MNSTLRELGGVMGIALAVAAFAGAGGYGSAQAFSDGFVAAIGVAACLSLLGALLGGLLGARGRAGQASTDAQARSTAPASAVSTTASAR